MLTVQKNSGILRTEGFKRRILRMAAQILTLDQIHWIRTSGLTDAHMARTLGVGYVTVHNARRGITFKDHPTPPDTALRKPGGKGGGSLALKSTKNCGVRALTDDAVHFIRTSGLPDSILATMYDVSRALVTRTRRGLARQDHSTPPDLFPRTRGQHTYAGNEALLRAPTIDLGFEPANRTLFDRLRTWCRIDTDGCWIWTGSVTGSEPRPSGHHGRTSIDGHAVSTHRAMWIAVYGEIPDGLCVCHECDKPPCIHPLHLWLGTHLDNMRDSIEKGRHVNVRGRRK